MVSHEECANALRFLAVDAIERAGSGHPGAPLGMADMATVLWQHFLRHSPANPRWANRDRFILSNGHASMLLYALLHLTGYDLTLDDLRAFRQLHSKTPGHPEYGATPGVETTTGPLGQGLAMAVGMALAEKKLALQFNRPDFPIVDHFTYVFLGDGCLMEGLSHEAAALAGVWQLGKLIVLYDQNGISIDGNVSGWFTENVPGRFAAYGWQVIREVDGHDPRALRRALLRARREKARPTLICCRTHIGFGAPHKQDTAACHGSPLGADETAAMRARLGWPWEPFVIPAEIARQWNGVRKGRRQERKWDALFASYEEKYPELAAEFSRRMLEKLPFDWEKVLEFGEAIHQAPQALATRVASQRVISRLLPLVPELLGGSADLTGSVGTKGDGMTAFSALAPEGNHISYGVREFAMGAIMNGLALHGGFLPYGGTFLVFSDYARNAIRLSALMGVRVVWVLTHDSIGLGEDGPTHQPVEQLPSLRLVPGLDVWRPCDEEETFYAWKSAIEAAKNPTAFVLSRQKLPPQERDRQTARAIARGGYILKDAIGEPEAILLASGSEVDIAMRAAAELFPRRVRVVSMPCTEIFDAQDEAWREMVLPPQVRTRVAVEAAHVDGWQKYVGLDGAVIGMKTFGASAPAGAAYDFFGITVKDVVAAVRRLLEGRKTGGC